ncbi:T9SS type A sorting domain-containing protein [Hymenobacter sp. ASUV-10]|uniref:T9SS type A sorting domain-containing protein n=1 Tax=Hymenobacter aranciens TaxID=3063996 RepID=A0ABT9B873_9BACT|nr:T9SS type A sorting domain-containing protein [Hymenobacter sp. ASUV-10]MDO7874474.1 T9SS type A sorting domain-containing protein [Hymenobacter sp. ASUV-10]
MKKIVLPALLGLAGLGLAHSAAAQATFVQWPMTANNSDNAAVRTANIRTVTPTFRRFVLSDGNLPTGTGNQAFPAYSAAGQAFALTSAGGGWSSNATPLPGPGSTPRRAYYEQFVVTAATAAHLDSVTMNLSVFNTASGRVAVAYSRSSFVSDSTSVTGGTGPAIANTTNNTPGGVLPAANNGSFGVNSNGNAGAQANNAALLPQGTASGVADRYAFALNGATGVDLTPGQSLTVRIYVGASTTGIGRYALLRNVTLKSAAAGPTATANARVVKNGLQLAPNPATEQVAVSHPAAKAGATVALYSITGQKIIATRTQPGTTATTLDLRTLATGLYLVEYADGEQRVTARIAKN